MKKLFLALLSVIIIFACSKVTDKEYFDQAGSLVKEKKIKDAISKYESLIKEFPESNLAVKSLLEIAKLYEMHSVDSVSFSESFKMASVFYFNVFEKYPDSKEAPVALFQSGFILDNELKNYDEATKRYNLFLEKYPDHKYAPIVKQSLDIMGLSPEDIINKKQSAKN